jgi:peptidoglycan/xylan/chitin deacetylase (PgdA/CDA1 family)
MAAGPLGVMRLPGIPVLAYHRLVEAGEPVAPNMGKYCLTPGEFRRHMEQVRVLGKRVLLLRDLFGPDPRITGGEVVISFDDGFDSDYESAFPFLREAGSSAEFFVNSATVGTPGFVSWQQLAEMQRAGMSIQSHGHDHLDFVLLSSSELERQLKVSKQTIEDRLGSEVSFFAAPFGRLNAKVVRAALQAGYRAVCGTRCLTSRPNANKLNRVVVYRDISSDWLSAVLNRVAWPYLARLASSPLYHWPLRLLQPEAPAAYGEQ